MNKLLESIGQQAIFHIPAEKLDKKYSYNSLLQKMSKIIHDFFLENFNAYTRHPVTYGVWRKGKDSKVMEDSCVQYEVSFDGKEDLLIDFLSEICDIMEEECIYLTIKGNSYLVKGKK